MATLPIVNQAELTGLLAEALKITGLFAGGVVGGPAGYAAIAVNAAGIWNEVANIINTGNVPVEDITAAHADAQIIHDARILSFPVNPQDAEYDTMEEAKTHLGGTYITVQQLPNGKFVCWQNIGPVPGVQVYP